MGSCPDGMVPGAGGCGCVNAPSGTGYRKGGKAEPIKKPIKKYHMGDMTPHDHQCSDWSGVQDWFGMNTNINHCNLAGAPWHPFANPNPNTVAGCSEHPCCQYNEATQICEPLHSGGGGNFMPGDTTGDGVLNVLDIIRIVHHVIGEPDAVTGEPFQMTDPNELAAADFNGDGNIDVNDVIAIIEHLGWYTGNFNTVPSSQQQTLRRGLSKLGITLPSANPTPMGTGATNIGPIKRTKTSNPRMMRKPNGNQRNEFLTWYNEGMPENWLPSFCIGKGSVICFDQYKHLLNRLFKKGGRTRPKPTRKFNTGGNARKGNNRLLAHGCGPNAKRDVATGMCVDTLIPMRKGGKPIKKFGHGQGVSARHRSNPNSNVMTNPLDSRMGLGPQPAARKQGMTMYKSGGFPKGRTKRRRMKKGRRR